MIGCVGILRVGGEFNFEFSVKFGAIASCDRWVLWRGEEEMKKRKGTIHAEAGCCALNDFFTTCLLLTACRISGGNR